MYHLGSPNETLNLIFKDIMQRRRPPIPSGLFGPERGRATNPLPGRGEGQKIPPVIPKLITSMQY